MKRFLTHVAERFQVNIMSITPAMLDEFLRTMNCSAGSRNTYRRKLVALFNFARRLGYLPDRSTAADRTAKAKEAGREIEIFRPDEMALLLEHATDKLKPFIVLCGFCGLRAAEARRLDWREVHFAEGFIEVKASKAKTASRRLAPLPDNAAAWLRSIAERDGLVVKLSRLIHALQRLGKRVNEALEEDKKEPMRMPRNALRHSFVSYRLAMTQNPNQTALEAGHDVKILFRHYRELVTKAKAEKWFAINPPVIQKNILPMERDSLHPGTGRHGKVIGGFSLPTHCRRARSFEIAICDVKDRARRTPHTPFCIHRTWRTPATDFPSRFSRSSSGALRGHMFTEKKWSCCNFVAIFQSKDEVQPKVRSSRLSSLASSASVGRWSL